jgi:hypothetical protein
MSRPRDDHRSTGLPLPVPNRLTGPGRPAWHWRRAKNVPIGPAARADRSLHASSSPTDPRTVIDEGTAAPAR